MATKVIYKNMFSQVDGEGNRQFLFDEIIDKWNSRSEVK